MKGYIEGADDNISAKINSIKYGKSDRTWKVSNKITIGWKSVLPEPPANNSDFTRMELNKIAAMTKELKSEQVDLVKMVDTNPRSVFEKMIKEHNLKYHKDEVDKAWAITKPVILNLKWKFNRPRPYQLAEVYGVDIKVLETDTHHTPAYPSGHSAEAAIMGYLLAEYYPEHSTEIFNKIDLAAKARVLQGVHYPSDNDASMVITGALWQDIKHDIIGEK
tara:strand:- start:306 stop:965 length:660 start_codon:yes stop_codon:yes gene_type:complete